MDRYRLIVSGNGRTIGGLSRNLGDWDGQLFLIALIESPTHECVRRSSDASPRCV